MLNALKKKNLLSAVALHPLNLFLVDVFLFYLPQASGDTHIFCKGNDSAKIH